MLAQRRPAAPPARGELVACHECDLLQRLQPFSGDSVQRCARCRALLLRYRVDGAQRSLAWALTGVMLFLITNAFPIVTLELQGIRNNSTLAGTVLSLWHEGLPIVAGVVAITTICVPGIMLAAMLYLLLPLNRGVLPAGSIGLLRALAAMRPWGMVEVFLLGVLVALVKLTHFASVIPGTALWSLGALVIALAAMSASFHADEVWRRIGIQPLKP